jgi:hypothetical protein
MSLKKGGGPKTIAATLTIVGQGSTDKVQITYHNRKSSEVEARLKERPDGRMAVIIPFIVEAWDLDFELTEEGVIALEDEYPGLVAGILDGFYKARRKQVEGN